MVTKKGLFRTGMVFGLSVIASGCHTVSNCAPHPFTNVFYNDAPVAAETAITEELQQRPEIADLEPPDFGRF